MEVSEAERIVIAKPVASRPNCSGFKSFSELLAGAINASPPNVCFESVVPAIRPKTVRFKPFVNRAPSATISSQAEQSGIGVTISSDKVLKSIVVYKPQAKLVSKTTVSLLANMGNFTASNEPSLQSMEAPTEYANQEKTRFIQWDEPAASDINQNPETTKSSKEQKQVASKPSTKEMQAKQGASTSTRTRTKVQMQGIGKCSGSCLFIRKPFMHGDRTGKRRKKEERRRK